jgi:hypothetical protein
VDEATSAVELPLVPLLPHPQVVLGLVVRILEGRHRLRRGERLRPLRLEDVRKPGRDPLAHLLAQASALGRTRLRAAPDAELAGAERSYEEPLLGYFT